MEWTSKTNWLTLNAIVDCHICIAAYRKKQQQKKKKIKFYTNENDVGGIEWRVDKLICSEALWKIAFPVEVSESVYVGICIYDSSSTRFVW